MNQEARIRLSSPSAAPPRPSAPGRARASSAPSRPAWPAPASSRCPSDTNSVPAPLLTMSATTGSSSACRAQAACGELSRRRPEHPASSSANARSKPAHAWSIQSSISRRAMLSRRGSWNPCAAGSRSSARREPARIAQLVRLDGDLVRQALGIEAEHDAGRERPGLAAVIAHRADPHAALLEHLARHRLLQALAGLHEPGQRRIHRACSGKRCEWPSSTRSPRWTSMITAGSVRGKCCAPQAVQTIACPALRGSQAAPHTPQNRCRTRQCIRPRACARIAASSPASPPASARRSSNRPSSSGSSGSGSSTALTSTANTACSSCRPRNAQGPPAIRTASAASPVRNTACGGPSPCTSVRDAPDRHEQAGRVGQPVRDPGLVVAQRAGTVQRAAGVDIGAAGEDQGHCAGFSHARVACATPGKPC